MLRKVDGAEILRRVERHGVTLLCGAPAVVAVVLDAAAAWDGPIPGRGPRADGRRRRAAADRTIERVETELGWEFIQIYGLTETAPLLTMNRGRAECDDLDARRAGRGASAGPARRRSACDLRSTTRARCWPASNVVLEGYWEQPEATADAIADGWFHTGDGGRRRRRYLTISDRKKDVIISGGENVASIEVEDALFQHPAVAEVAVIGVPDEKWGETVKALVVLRAGSERHRGRADRALPRAARRLQVPDVGRVPRRAGPHRHRQAAEVQAPRALLGRPGAPGQLTAALRPAGRLPPAPRSLILQACTPSSGFRSVGCMLPAATSQLGDGAGGQEGAGDDDDARGHQGRNRVRRVMRPGR